MPTTNLPLVPPVVLLGPPGAGKSAVAPRVAAALGFACVDVDDVVGVDVLASEGVASFRIAELAALQSAVDRGAVVVSVGAGVVDTAAARAVLARCLCVGVDVDVDVALRRIPDGTRPWLPARGDPNRRDAYVAREAGRATLRRPLCAAVVDGNGSARVTEDAVVRAVFDYACGDDDDDAVVDDVPAGFVVADAGCGDDADLVVRVDESQKRLAVVEHLLESFARAGLARGDLVVVKGGGVVLDVAGLAAALYMRGTPWHAVPTTLLAMVDAASGGKTAVDLAVGDGHGGAALLRNGAGAFHPPRGVTLDARYLRTLTPALVRHGRAEMHKHALLGGASDVDASGASDGGAVDLAAVQRSRRIKSFFVRRDPRERHLRMALNLGHTFAHALESRFGLAHGDAVWHGVGLALRTSVRVCGLDGAFVDVHDDAARRAAVPPLPACSDADVDALVDAMRHDKKRAPGLARGALRLVLLRAPRQPIAAIVDVDAVRAAWRG